VLGRLLAGSRTALLEHELAQERGLLTEVSVEYTPTVDPGLFVVVARVTDGTSVAEAEQALRATMARVTRERVSEREVQRARNLAQMDLVHGLATIEGRADLFGTYELWFGDYNAVFRLEQRLAAVDATALQGLLQSFCRDDNLTVATLLPGASQPASEEEGDGDGDEGDDDMKGGGR
jgi:predicted Zn-dependent peptidase